MLSKLEMIILRRWSIRTRLTVTISLLIVLLIGGIVWLWTRNERLLHRQQKWHQAKTLALLLSTGWGNQFYEQNWSVVRVGLERLLVDNEDFVYILVSDGRSANRIVISAPKQFQNDYVPDLVPVPVTEQALSATCRSGERCTAKVAETFLLRDIEFDGKMRGRRGDRILEAAADIPSNDGSKIGTFRVGLSLRSSDRAVAIAIRKALGAGAVGLIAGAIFAYLLARRLSDPIVRLQASAAKIAAGDLQHRAEIYLDDEIGALANSFNAMSAKLQTSFNRLQQTIDIFERFVPNKFLAVLAPEGIENIQVGIAANKVITILFCDIRGYTSMSEQLTSMETFTFLNDYLACMGKAIADRGGFIDKYIGDAIMALFDSETTDSALEAAALMQQELAIFNQKQAYKGMPTIAVGIGIHRGEVVMGTVGFASRIESTVIGDAVNLASRLEGLTKNYHCSILVSEAVVNALQNPAAFNLRLIDTAVKVKGKDEAIAVYVLDA